MEPRIQYAKTKDGVNIAFWTVGEGRPVVFMPIMPISHVQLEWRVGEFRARDEQVAITRKLIKYDGRGSGLSERDIPAQSLDTLVLDLEAVADHLGLETFAIIATIFAGFPAVAYAAHHPDRVSHLVLCDACARGEDLWRLPYAQAFRAFIEKDWALAAEAFAHFAWGWSGDEAARQYAAVVRESNTAAGALAFLDFARSLDVSDLLGEIKCPTLVIQTRSEDFGGNDRIRMARDLASRIPGARLLLIEGRLGEAEVVDARWAAFDEFVGEGQAAVPPRPSTSDAVHTVLFTDIEGSTALTQRLGDAAAQDVLRAHNAIVREGLKSCGGTEIKHTGDGIMASFPSASRALECAIAIQRAVAGQRETRFRVRIGLNAGEPVAEESDLFGSAVQLARRVCDRAESNQILVSDVVRQLVSGKGFLFADTGDVALKGFEDPVRLYEVRWREDI